MKPRDSHRRTGGWSIYDSVKILEDTYIGKDITPSYSTGRMSSEANNRVYGKYMDQLLEHRLDNGASDP